MKKQCLIILLGIIANSSIYQALATQYESPFICQKEPFYYMVLTKAVDQSLPSDEQEKRWRHEQTSTVFALSDKNKIVLNPDGEAYPKSFRLKQLTLKEAETAWGEARSEASNIKTFDLSLLTGSPSQRKGYNIDTKFNDGYLSAYRVRGPLISNQKWTSVK